MADVYEAGAFCTNCGYEGPVTAPIGKPVYEVPCPLCATKMLRAIASRDWDRSMRELPDDR